MVPKSLSIWLQRAGRAARAMGAQGRAYLLVQPSVFQEKNKSQRKEDDEVEFVKTVEEYLRKWIETKDCRRDVQDDCFNNPPGRKSKLSARLLSLQLMLMRLTRTNWALLRQLRAERCSSRARASSC